MSEEEKEWDKEGRGVRRKEGLGENDQHHIGKDSVGDPTKPCL